MGIIAGLFLLGCATPSGTHREYFGFTNTPPERQQPQQNREQTASEPSVERHYEWVWGPAPTYVVVVPEWASADWYAPWYPYPVYYCRPGYYRWGYWRYRPWYAPPVVVVVPVERIPEPPQRVRTFGPSRGTVEPRPTTVSGEEGGGRLRGRESGDTASTRERKGSEETVRAQPVQEGSAQSQISPGQTEQTTGQGGGRTRTSKAAEKTTEKDEDVTVRTRSKQKDTEGGGRSRRKTQP
ncbi:MAG: hypothetical protein NZ473_03760 [Candidatus Kapabacteria bacterium]|nr:hypothetical protein [Candidatus Kapabacteria bacterium]